MQSVTIAGKSYNCVREGLADILAPRPEDGQEAKKTRTGGEEQSVFHNPIQTFNRDLSVLAAKVFAEELTASRLAKRKTGSRRKEKNLSKRKRVAGEAEQNGADGTEELPVSKKTKTDAGANNVGDVTGGDSNAAKTVDSMDIDDNANGESGQAPLNAPKTAEGDAENDTTQPKRSHFRILDALSATGLRALRYAKEIPEASFITANDLSAEAVDSIKRNVEYNKVKDKVHPLQGNAAGHMYFIGTEQKLPDGTPGKYDVIDLDPYGTAAPFIDAAVQALSDGGMLAVTCTDSGVFASVGYLEKTYTQYGGLPWKGSQSHEAGLRLIIHCVAKSAARYGLAIEPLLSLSIDYYVRIFIRVRKSPAEVKLLPGKTLTVYNCDAGCGAWKKQYDVRTQVRENKNGGKIYHFTAGQGPTTIPHCEHCGYVTHLAGPMWGGYLHNPDFVQRLLDRLPSLDQEIYTTIPRLEGMLTLALNETLLPVENEKGSLDKEAISNEAQPATNRETASETVTAPDEPTYKPLERLDPAAADEHPFFFRSTDLARVLHTSCPKESAMRGALIGLGYRVTSSHTKPNTIRTDAPWSVLWDVMRAWVHKDTPKKANSAKEGSAAVGLWKTEQSDDVKHLEKSLLGFLGGNEKKTKAALAMIEAMKDEGRSQPEADPKGGEDAGEANESAPSDEASKEEKDKNTRICYATSATGEKLPVVFDERLGSDPDRGRMVRYQINPRENWGPQSRAK